MNSATATLDSALEPVSGIFKPRDYLLGIVQRAMTSGENIRIILPGKGELVILPTLGVYYAKTRDLIEFICTPAILLKIEGCDEKVLPDGLGSRMNLNALLWQTAFHASQGRLIEGCSKYDVVKFRHWPNLTRLPITPNTARICALLTRNPTTIMLVHRVLGIDREEVYQIYSAASSAGICHKIGKGPESENAEVEFPDRQPKPVNAQSLLSSLFAKISRL